MLFRCPLCNADIMVNDDTSLLTCQGCQAVSIVERRHGTIALKIHTKPTNTTKSQDRKLREPLSLGKLTKELVELKQESSTIRGRKIVGAFAGGICGTLFGYMGSLDLIGKDFGSGVTMLVCAAAAFGFLRFVMRDSAASASSINGKIEEIEFQIAERQKADIQRLFRNGHLD